MKKFLICLFGGWFGLHKFLDKKVGQGILYLCTLGLFCIGWWIDCIKYFIEAMNEKKAAELRQQEAERQEQERIREQERLKQEELQREKEKAEKQSKIAECRKRVADDPEEYKRLNKLCSEIHKEYKGLLSDYRGLSVESDTDRMVYILKECYRKLEVIETNIDYYACYDNIDIYEEQDKICKKARSFINSYIRMEKDSGTDNYMIDITQFADDLEFICDYISDKDLKLSGY